MRKRNIFSEISNGRTDSERKFFDKLVAERIDPVTGEAHYYNVSVTKSRTNYKITIPRTEYTKQQFPTLENNDLIKVIVQRDNDKYLILKERD